MNHTRENIPNQLFQNTTARSKKKMPALNRKTRPRLLFNQRLKSEELNLSARFMAS